MNGFNYMLLNLADGHCIKDNGNMEPPPAPFTSAFYADIDLGWVA